MIFKFYIFGKSRDKYIIEGCDEFVKRISKFTKVEIINLKEEPIENPNDPSSISKALDKEAEKLLKQIKETDYTFLLDVKAKQLSSKEFTEALSNAVNINGNINFVIGSSYGLSNILRERANFAFSLSQFTFTHYMTLLLILEQVYRGLKTINGQIYDK